MSLTLNLPSLMKAEFLKLSLYFILVPRSCQPDGGRMAQRSSVPL